MIVAAAVATGCSGEDRGDRTAAPTSTVAGGGAGVRREGSPELFGPGPRSRARGGSARVGVWGEPDPSAATLAGAGVRALVMPQMFVALPDGRWAASLAEPGSDRTGPGAGSASFRLRPGASWSDGSPIGVEDLRRSADPRFVAAVDGPATDGTITVTFRSPLPGWRRLWSGVDSVRPSGDGVWGGPFTVAERTPGLDLVLRRNERWYGPAPYLDELRLVLVPDSTSARQLLGRGELEVVMPPAATVRTPQLERTGGVAVASAARTGWWVGLWLNPDRLGPERRRAVASTVDRRRFVATLLQDEAVVLDGLAGPEDGTWRDAPAGNAEGARGDPVEVTGQVEEPMTPLLLRSMQKRARAARAQLEPRLAEAHRVEAWLASGEYQSAVALAFDGPDVCWVCRAGHVDEPVARLADGGNPEAVQALQARLRDEALVMPLWRGRAVVAWRDGRGGLGGVIANGYALTAAWNSWDWWRA